MNEEMKECKERWQKNTDDHNTYSVAVAVEKLLSFLLPVNESIELVCLEFFGDEDMKGMIMNIISLSIVTLEKKGIEAFMNQIMAGTAEALKEIMENENASPFTILSQLTLLDVCIQDQKLLLKSNFLYNILTMAKKEITLLWKRYTCRSFLNLSKK